MIEELSGLPVGIIGFRATGKVTGDDYDKVLTPAVDRAIEEHHHIKLLAVLGPDFDGYSLEAAWDDTRLGLRHWSGFERIAVATDVAWINVGIRALGFMLPCPIKLFRLDEQDDARRWLEESLGTIHLNSSDDVIVAQLIGKLEASAYDDMDEKIADAFSHTEHPRLLLDLREFDGWSGLSALSQHLSLVREHRRKPERIAVVGNKAWQRLAEKVMSQFVNAKAHFFDGDDYDGALAWVAQH
jgi:anti-anti-sigma regulatory factor